jgi:serine/threonine protein kinase/formylglycine-generating enzyme required for sulfatase activity/Leucine-rich repeat (LRR) protein
MCPNRERLQAVLLGLLSDAESEQVEQHLFECQRCVETMAELGAGDTLVEAIKAQPSIARELAGYSDQVQAVIGRWKGKSRVGFDLTPPVSSAEEPTSDGNARGTADDLNESLRLLAPAQTPDELGRLGQYRILRVLGSGGMGIVFEAEDLRLKRRVALKAMKPTVAASSSSRKRFLREAQAAASVEHDHIVPIYQVGEDGGVPFIAMPLLRGETLADCLASGTRQCAGKSQIEAGEKSAADVVSNADTTGRLMPPARLPLAEVIRIGREIATGLDVAHRAGLIHRDIKPGNIWLEAGSGRVKILDFGLARAASTDEHLTHTGALLGTPSYMAPEQARSDQIDARADLFSLGCVLYHMATGVRPFVGHNALSTLLAITTHDPRPPRELNPELPTELNELIVALLSKNPSGRPQSAHEVAVGLASIANGVPTSRAGSEPMDHRSPHSPSEVHHHAGRDVYGSLSSGAALIPLAPLLGEGDKLPLAPGEGRGEGSGATTGDVTQAAPQTNIPPVPPRWRFALVSAAAAAALLAAVVFYLQTNNGRIRVEINDPQIEVAIKGTNITFQKADNDTDVKVSPGEKTLIVQRGDFTFETDKLILKRGDTLTISVTLLAGEVEVKQGDQLIGHRKLSTGWQGWPSDAPAPAIAPFDAVQARKHQQAWADYLHLPREYTNRIGMKFVLIPPGEFMMGSSPEEIEEKLKVAGDDELWQEYVRSEAPLHKVVLTQPIYLGVHEVTQNEYQAVMGKNPSNYAKTGTLADSVAGLETENFPVEGVSWNDAAEFCARLSQQDDLKPFYFRTGETVTPLIGTGYRLPTEAEWEFSCRAGTTTRSWNGDAAPAGWYGANSDERTHEVEGLPGNAFGLFDVHGNVWEWAHDAWDPKYYEQFVEKPAINPSCFFSDVSERAIRGGCCGDPASYCRSSNRQGYAPTDCWHIIGFRVVLVVDAVNALLERGANPMTTARTGQHGWPREGAPDLDREVASWLLSSGLGVDLIVDGKPMRLSAGETLPPGNIKVFQVWMSDRSHWTLERLSQLAGLSNLVALVVPGCEIGDAQLAHLRGAPALAYLDLYRNPITGGGLLAAVPLPKLISLGIIATDVSDTDLANLTAFPELADLRLERRHLTAVGVGNLARLPKLSIIELGTDVGDDELENIRPLKRLMWLRAGGTAITDAGLQHLSALPKLSKLELGGACISDVGLAHVAKLSQLTSLKVSGPKMNDAVIKHLGSLKNLTHLDLRPTMLMATSDERLMPNLVTAAGVAELRAALPNCEILWEQGPLSTVDPNREVLKWALEIGGKVFIADGDFTYWPEFPVTDISKLPEEFQWVRIQLFACDRLVDADLARFRSLTKPFLLSFSASKITNAGLANLHDLPNLRALDLPQTAITREGIEALGVLPNLYAINIGRTATTGDDLQLLSRFPKLDRVTLGPPHLTDEGVNILATLPNIVMLYIIDAGEAECERIGRLAQLTGFFPSGKNFNDRCVEAIRRLPNLTILDLYQTSVTDDGIAKLPSVAPKVSTLRLAREHITDAALPHIREMPALSFLSLVYTQVTASGVAELQAAMPNLRINWSPALPPPTGDPDRDAAEWVLAVGGKVDLLSPTGEVKTVSQSADLPAGKWNLVTVRLRGPYFSDDDFRRLAALKMLGSIHIADAKIDGAALAHIGKLPAIWQVYIVNTRVGDAGLAAIKELPNLTALHLVGSDITDADMRHVAAMRRLDLLNLNHNRSITDTGLNHLGSIHGLRHLYLSHANITDKGAELLSRHKQLQSLALDYTDITDRGLEAIADLAALTKLSVAGTRITDEGLPTLANLRKLKVLEIGGTIITDLGVVEIAKLTDLERFSLPQTRVGDDGIEKLAALTKLQDLDLSSTEITDEGLKHLKVLSNLKRLDVSHTEVTAAGIDALKAALPGCEVIHDPAATTEKQITAE